jgi:hypothetical protein
LQTTSPPTSVASAAKASHHTGVALVDVLGDDGQDVQHLVLRKASSQK